MSEPTPGSSAPNTPAASEDPFVDLLMELDESVRAIKSATRRLKRVAGGMQAVERNADRILASTRMLEINVSDLLRDTDGFASFGDDHPEARELVRALSASVSRTCPSRPGGEGSVYNSLLAKGLDWVSLRLYS